MKSLSPKTLSKSCHTAELKMGRGCQERVHSQTQKSAYRRDSKQLSGPCPTFPKNLGCVLLIGPHEEQLSSRGYPPSPPRTRAPERQSAGLHAARGRGSPASPSVGQAATRPPAVTRVGTERPGEHLAPPGWTHLSVPLLSTPVRHRKHTFLKNKCLDAAFRSKHTAITIFLQ